LSPTASLAGEIPHTEASFGTPQYGASITGRLYYQSGNELGCKTVPVEAEGPGAVIVLYDRGECAFSAKVLNAQGANAHAVIIVDNVADGPDLIMADDGTGANIAIPALFVRKEYGDKIKAEMSTGTNVMVKLHWSMPSPDNHVEWSLWTSANDPNSVSFKHQFAEPAKHFGLHATFTPHYLVIGGTWFDCDEFFELESGERVSKCGKQCTNSGRYCAEDPEQNQDMGVDGEDVVQENLRQICLWRAVNATSSEGVWWDYVQQFQTLCAPDAASFTRECSDGVLLKYPNGAELIESVGECVVASGGSDSDGGINTLLEHELSKRMEASVILLPTVRINNRDYRGKLSCPEPIALGSCPVLAAICDGYDEGTSPAVCSGEYCWKGTDICGVCGGDNSTCTGCDGVPASGKVRDICGRCGGDGSFDKCGMCLPANDLVRDTTCMGCDGVINGGKAKDACGVCGGDGSFDKCGRCYSANDKRRQDVECLEDAVLDVVHGVMRLEGITVAMLVDDTSRMFERAVAQALGITSDSDVIIDSVTEAKDALVPVATTESPRRNLLRDSKGPKGEQHHAAHRRLPVDATRYTSSGVIVHFHVSTDPTKGTALAQVLKQAIDEGILAEDMRQLGLPVAAAVQAEQSQVTVASARTMQISAQNQGSNSLIFGIVVGATIGLIVLGFAVRSYVNAREDMMRNDVKKLLQKYVPIDKLSAEDLASSSGLMSDDLDDDQEPVGKASQGKLFGATSTKDRCDSLPLPSSARSPARKGSDNDSSSMLGAEESRSDEMKPDFGSI
jgi:hypothetical protein